jgi:hypothetical protein
MMAFLDTSDASVDWCIGKYRSARRSPVQVNTNMMNKMCWSYTAEIMLIATAEVCMEGNPVSMCLHVLVPGVAKDGTSKCALILLQTGSMQVLHECSTSSRYVDAF